MVYVKIFLSGCVLNPKPLNRVYLVSYWLARTIFFFELLCAKRIRHIRPLRLDKPQPKLLKGGFIGDCIGTSIGLLRGKLGVLTLNTKPSTLNPILWGLLRGMLRGQTVALMGLYSVIGLGNASALAIRATTYGLSCYVYCIQNKTHQGAVRVVGFRVQGSRV